MWKRLLHITYSLVTKIEVPHFYHKNATIIVDTRIKKENHQDRLLYRHIFSEKNYESYFGRQRRKIFHLKCTFF